MKWSLTGLHEMKPITNQPQGNPMHKHLKISAELHTEIKKEAKTNGMFIDAFLRKALEDHRKQKMLRELRGL